MGQKISPRALRLGYIQDWDSRWFNPREMPEMIEEDFRIRAYCKKKYRSAALSKVVIERTGAYIRINLHTARPGIIIGRRGADIEELKKVIQTMTKFEATINVIEVKRAELDAQLVSEGVAFQLEKQMMHRRVLKRTIERTMSAGAGGIKIMVAGRLNGAEIARTEWQMEGRVPLHTFRADIDYGFSEAHITMGRIGVKVWIFKKEFFQKSEKDLIKEAEAQPILSSEDEEGSKETATEEKATVRAPAPPVMTKPEVSAPVEHDETSSPSDEDPEEA